jgi:hypothetical protein
VKLALRITTEAPFRLRSAKGWSQAKRASRLGSSTDCTAAAGPTVREAVAEVTLPAVLETIT